MIANRLQVVNKNCWTK